MSKNEEKKRENSKPQQNENKLRKVNKKRGNNEEKPLSKERRADDISRTFPNFCALTETERFVFFQALTTARKNVEQKKIPTRQCFGTVHDEYLKYFTQQQKKGNKVAESAKKTSCLTSDSVVRNDNTSSCINKSTFKVDSRDVPFEKSQSWISKNEVTSKKNDNELITNDPGLWDHCESIIRKNTKEVIDLYLKKKKRNETKFNNGQLTCEKLVESVGNKRPELLNKNMAEAERKKTESLGSCTVAKSLLKVRNTSKFDALNAEEKEIFFRTLEKAHDNVIKKNPKKEREILSPNAVMERCQAYSQSSKVFTTSQELPRREDGRRNLKRNVILTSGDNKRLSKTKSQVFSDNTKEGKNRRHKSAESLYKKGKEPSRSDKTPDQADQSETSFSNVRKASKDSLEINDTSTSKLKRQKKTKKFKKTEKKEENPEECQGREKEKIKRKEKKSSFRTLRTAHTPTYEPKSINSLKVNDLVLPVTSQKKKIKDIVKEFQNQKKNLPKNKMEKIKKGQEKEKLQKKKELVFESENLLSLGNVESHENTKESDSSKLIEEQCTVEANKCETRVTKEMLDKCEKETFTDVNGSKENCEGTWWQLKSEQNEKRDIKKSDEAVNEEEEEKREIKCIIAFEERENGMGEIAVTFEQKEEETLETNSESLRNVTTEEVVLFDSNLGAKEDKEDNTTAMKSLLLDGDNDCDDERMKSSLESDHESLEPLVVKTQKDIIDEGSVLQKVIKGTSSLEEKPLEEKKITEIELDFAPGKLMFLEDDLIEKLKSLLFYLEGKIQKDDHLKNEYLQLLLDYVDCLSEVFESWVLGEKLRHPKQVQEKFTATEVHLKVDNTSLQSQKKEGALHSKEVFEQRSVSCQDLISTIFKLNLAEPITETTAETSKEKRSNWKSNEEVSAAMKSKIFSDSKIEVRLAPINADDKKVLTTNNQLVQDLLHQRAEFVEESIAGFKVVDHLEAENFVPKERPPTIKILTDEDKENPQQNHKKKFFKLILKWCFCGKKKAEDDGIIENLKERPSELTCMTKKKMSAHNGNYKKDPRKIFHSKLDNF